MTISNTHYQTSYGFQPAGIVGEIADRDGTEAETERVNGEATNAIDFGTVVVRDSSAKETKCKRPAASTDEILGVAIVSGSVSADDSDDREFDAGDYTRILTRGKVWMEAAGTLAAGDTPWVVLSGADQGKVGPSSAGGAQPQVSLTISGVLDGGRGRIETITFDADLITANQFDCDVYGVAIDSVTFSASHATTMTLIKEAILEAGGDDILGVSLSDQTNNRVLTVIGRNSNNTGIITNAAVTLGASQAGTTVAQDTAGAAPHQLSVDVDGTTVTQDWTGESDDTMAEFAAQLEGLAKVESAVVTVVPAGDDVTITLTGANKVADDIDLTNPLVNNGATARTMSVNNEVTPGVAATAMEWSQARVVKGGSDGDVIKVSIDVSPKP